MTTALIPSASAAPVLPAPPTDQNAQILPEADQDKFEFDPLDATKVWPEELVPIDYVGEYELNRNVDEYFTETEQVAFCT
ncbi:MAG: catalase, partial [Hymenobacter sp.]